MRSQKENRSSPEKNTQFFTHTFARFNEVEWKIETEIEKQHLATMQRRVFLLNCLFHSSLSLSCSRTLFGSSLRRIL